ncbi:hypothetical protein HPB47_003096 [Ixodes persulcatus]|uniref:Uncharacterized protein n=1 Tax=Ixodes persulcatus TaxID=34615 RepID=A0AC60PKI9_IXOPE|nr:hypothetical protein HPB47_003096 [Ixodes persulcatus]
MPPCETPRNCQLEAWQVDSNHAHSPQRVVIEMAFGDLKQQFQRLYDIDTDSIQWAVLIVVGACVLTNLCNSERDALLEPQDPTRESGISVSSPEGLKAEPSSGREVLCDTMFFFA